MTTYISKLNSKIILKKYFCGDILDSTSTMVNNHVIERVIYEMGIMKEYYFYSISGDLCYHRQFDSLGNFVKYEGIPCFYGFHGFSQSDVDTSNITNIDTVTSYFFAPTLPHIFTNFFVSTLDSLYPVFYKIDDINCGYYTIKNPYKTGYWQLCVSMKFYDSITDYKVRKDKCIIFKVDSFKANR